MTAQQFLQAGSSSAAGQAPFRYPKQTSMPVNKQHALASNALPPSVQPATMQPIALTLDPSLVAAGLPAPAVTKQPAPTGTPAVTTTPTVTPAPVVSPTATVTVTPTVQGTTTPAATATVPAKSTLPGTALPHATTTAATSTSYVSFLRADGSLDVTSSDGRFEILIPAKSLDFAQAKLEDGTQPQDSLTLNITQLHGHSVGNAIFLGTYQVQIVNSKGKALTKIRLHQPVTIKYHYTPQELASLQLNPDHLKLMYPIVLHQASQRNKPVKDASVALTNDPQTHTLSAQTTLLDASPLVVSGSAELQQPAQPLLASMQGNSGTLSYSYPISVVPGIGGFAPKLALTYSSESTSERRNPRDPTGSAGEGWSLTLGAITAQAVPSSSAEQPPSTSPNGLWYFISGVDNVNDRLIPKGNNLFDTEHLAYMRIQYGSNCFQVWDKSGYYYEFGCTPDSLQYYKDALGTHNYSWNLSRVIVPYNATTQVRQMRISYLQDIVTTNGYTSVRDSAIKQIQYGSTTSLGTTIGFSTLAGTVDFSYHMPTVPSGQSAFATAYGTNYHCQSSPLANTTLRCDDPTDYNDSISGQSYAPTVMSTMELDSVTSYVGDDSSASNKDYSYAFQYYDTPDRYVCSDSITGNRELCAGTHLLQNVTPYVYQNGTAHQLKPLSVFYGGGNSNTYYDESQVLTQGSNKVNYQMGNTWSYLTKYIDQDTGVGEAITYGTAYNNTHETPLILDSKGNIVDDRFDPLYCWNQRNNSNTSLQCNGNYAHPDDRAWSTQVVTQITALGKDSSASGLQNATTTYHYALAATGNTNCNSINNSTYPLENDCVGDNWLPWNVVTGKNDADWADFYHSEYRGFNVVYKTSPAGNLNKPVKPLRETL